LHQTRKHAKRQETAIPKKNQERLPPYYSCRASGAAPFFRIVAGVDPPPRGYGPTLRGEGGPNPPRDPFVVRRLPQCYRTAVAGWQEGKGSEETARKAGGPRTSVPVAPYVVNIANRGALVTRDLLSSRSLVLPPWGSRRAVRPRDPPPDKPGQGQGATPLLRSAPPLSGDSAPIRFRLSAPVHPPSRRMLIVLEKKGISGA